jgi:hypothetical protein
MQLSDSLLVMFRYTKVISIIFMSLNSIPISIFFDIRMRCYLTWLFSLIQFIKTFFAVMGVTRYKSNALL